MCWTQWGVVPPIAPVAPITIEIPSANDKRMSLIRAFYERYSYRLDLANQPSEQTLSILLKLHQRKSAEFAPLSKVSNALDNKDVRIEPTRIKGTPLLIDPKGQNAKNENNIQFVTGKLCSQCAGSITRLCPSVGERPPQ